MPCSWYLVLHFVPCRDAHHVPALAGDPLWSNYKTVATYFIIPFPSLVYLVQYLSIFNSRSPPAGADYIQRHTFISSHHLKVGVAPWRTMNWFGFAVFRTWVDLLVVPSETRYSGKDNLYAGSSLKCYVFWPMLPRQEDLSPSLGCRSLCISELTHVRVQATTHSQNDAKCHLIPAVVNQPSLLTNSSNIYRQPTQVITQRARAWPYHSDVAPAVCAIWHRSLRDQGLYPSSVNHISCFVR